MENTSVKTYQPNVENSNLKQEDEEFEEVHVKQGEESCNVGEDTIKANLDITNYYQSVGNYIKEDNPEDSDQGELVFDEHSLRNVTIVDNCDQFSVEDTQPSPYVRQENVIVIEEMPDEGEIELFISEDHNSKQQISEADSDAINVPIKGHFVPIQNNLPLGIQECQNYSPQQEEMYDLAENKLFTCNLPYFVETEIADDKVPHADKVIFKGKLCAHTATSHEDLLHHMKQKHDPSTLRKCRYCEFTTNDKWSMVKHYTHHYKHKSTVRSSSRSYNSLIDAEVKKHTRLKQKRKTIENVSLPQKIFIPQEVSGSKRVPVPHKVYLPKKVSAPQKVFVPKASISQRAPVVQRVTIPQKKTLLQRIRSPQAPLVLQTTPMIIESPQANNPSIVLIDEAGIVGNQPTQDEITTLVCNYCGYETKIKAKMDVHLTSKHKLNLGESSEYAAENEMVVRNQATDHPGTPKYQFQCPICKQITKNYASLQKHLNRQHKDRNLACVICKCVAENKADLNKHMIKFHPDMVTSSGDTDQHEEGEVEFDFLCKHCSFSTTDKLQIEMHVQTQHLVHDNNGKQRKTESQLIVGDSIKLVSTIEEIGNCRGPLPMSVDESKKIRDVFTTSDCRDVVLFACHQCEYRTTVRALAALHEVVKHSSESDFKCTCRICGLRFAVPDDLANHIQTVHLFR